MSVIEIRERLQQYIDNIDEILLTEMYTIISEEDTPYKYSVNDIAVFYKRRDAYFNGEGKNYTISESLVPIRP